jgi:protease I
MAKELSGRKVAFLVANEGVEQVELTRPWQAVERAGADAVLAAPKAGKTQAFNHLDKADTFDVDVTTDQLNPADYDGIVLPGGVANPDQLRNGCRRGALRPFVLRGGQAGCGHLPRTVDAH